jgi:hypothetical protein
MGDLMLGRSALVRSYEVAVMLFGFGRLRFFSFTRKGYASRDYCVGYRERDHVSESGGFSACDRRFRQRSEQYFTSSQQSFHFLRHSNGRWQTRQVFWGRFDFVNVTFFGFFILCISGKN